MWMLPLSLHVNQKSDYGMTSICEGFQMMLKMLPILNMLGLFLICQENKWYSFISTHASKEYPQDTIF